MKSKNIKITGLNDVYKFLEHTTKVDGDVTLFRGIYAVDAKSILGVFQPSTKQKNIIGNENIYSIPFYSILKFTFKY